MLETLEFEQSYNCPWDAGDDTEWALSLDYNLLNETTGYLL